MKSHQFDAVSFISGLVITMIGVLFLLPDTPEDLIDGILGFGPWFWPLVLVAIGLAVMIPVLLPKNQDDEDELKSTSAMS